MSAGVDRARRREGAAPTTTPRASPRRQHARATERAAARCCRAAARPRRPAPGRRAAARAARSATAGRRAARRRPRESPARAPARASRPAVDGDEHARAPRAPPQIDQRPRAEQQRDGENRQDRRPRVRARQRARAAARSAGAHLGLDQQAAAARRDRRRCTAAGARRRCDRRSATRSCTGTSEVDDGEGVGERRAALAAERLLGDDRREPRRLGPIRIDDRLDAHQARAEAARRDEQRGRAVDAFARQLGHAAGPGERGARRVVDGQPGPARVVRRPARRPPASKRRRASAGSRGAARIASRSAATRAASAPSVSALASNRWRSSASTCRSAVSSERAEPRPPHRPAGEADDERRRQAGARQTENQGAHGSHRIHGCYSEIDLDVKLLLKRGALLAAANWPTVAIQFIAETTFQVLLAVPIIGAAILVAGAARRRPRRAAAGQPARHVQRRSPAR